MEKSKLLILLFRSFAHKIRVIHIKKPKRKFPIRESVNLNKRGIGKNLQLLFKTILRYDALR